MGNPHKPVPKVFHMGPDGRIVRAPRTGDGYSVVRPGWRVVTEAEYRAAAAKVAAPKPAGEKPGKD